MGNNDDRQHVLLREVMDMLRRGAKIPERTFLRCAASSSAELKGVAFYVLFERPELTGERIEMSPDGVNFQFCLGFLVDCAVRDTAGAYALSRYDALNCLRVWLERLLCQRSVDREAVKAMKDALSDVYLQLGAGGRDMVMLTVLEHVFMYPMARDIFADWQEVPVLARAYCEAIELSDRWISQAKKDSSDGG